MTKAPRLMLTALLLGGFASQAPAMDVCLDDRSGLGVPARAGLVRELHVLFPKIDLQLGDCEAVSGSRVLLIVLPSRPGIPADALGLAYKTDDGILPRLELFAEPVMELTKAGDWETLGRALARVAAHELLHFLRQTDGHEAHGLLRERLTATELVSEELRPRLIASLQGD